MSGLADIAIGLGWSSNATAGELQSAIAATLATAGIDDDRVCCVATIDRKDNSPLIDTLAWPVLTFDAEDLARIVVPSPSDRVVAETGTPSVAEAAALLATGAGGSIVVAKQRFGHVTVALARSDR